MVQMLLVVLGLFWCSHVSQAIKCHRCNSLFSPECGEPFKQKETCTDDREDAVCFKEKVRIDGKFDIFAVVVLQNKHTPVTVSENH